MKRSTMCTVFVLAMAGVAHSDPPAKAPTLPPAGARTVPAAAAPSPFSGPALTLASARIQDGNLIILQMRLVAEGVQTAAGHVEVIRPLHEETRFPVDRATFRRPKGQTLDLAYVETVLAKARPVLLARSPAALEPAYLELVSPEAIVVVLEHRGRVPSFSTPLEKQQ